MVNVPDLLIVLCYDKDDIYYRFKEGLDNAIEKMLWY